MKYSYRQFLDRFRNLNGDPHYLAMGMAVGVFVGVTPTAPFHTAIAVAAAIILRGSKRSAVLGVWICNPLTIPLLYYGAYKIGLFFITLPTPFSGTPDSLSAILEKGAELIMVMMVGGLVMGVVFCIPSYWITKRIIVRMHRDTNKN